MAEKGETKVTKLPRRKRISKKTKKGWRKGSDVKDVEQFLEQTRSDERTGVFDGSSSRLFFVDDLKTLRGKKGKKSNSDLKCHRGLSLDSSVPPLHISQRVPKPLKKAVKKAAPKQARKRPARRNALYDLWSTTEATNSEEIDEHFANVCKKRRVLLPSHHSSKPSTIQSIEIPLPGASYNPSHDDHQILLKKAIEIEEKKAKDEKKLRRALDNLFPVVSEKPSEMTWLQEMSAGLRNDDDDDDDGDDGDDDKSGIKREEDEHDYDDDDKSGIKREEDEHDYDNDDKSGIKREEDEHDDDDDDDAMKSSFQVGWQPKKTEKQRRQEKERRLKEKLSLKLKEDKLREKEKFRLKSIKQELKLQEMKRATRAAWKELEKEENKWKPKKLGKLRYEEPTVNVKLSEELVDSLRKMKPEGHIAEIMFKHLQKKNIIEPRNRAKPFRRCKSKVFEKKGHRAVTL